MDPILLLKVDLLLIKSSYFYFPFKKLECLVCARNDWFWSVMKCKVKLQHVCNDSKY